MVANQTTLIPRKGQDIEADEVSASGGFTGNLTGGVTLGASDFVDLNGVADALVVDADGDTTISADTDDTMNFELNGVDHVVMKAVAGADSATTTSILKVAFTSPVDTTGTNTHNGLFVDVAIGNATGGTNEVRAIAIDNITGDAQVTETGILLGTGFDIGIDMQGTSIVLDPAGTTSIVASTNNQIDVTVNSAVDFRITANTFTALSGSTIVGEHRHLSQELTATGAITINSGIVLLNHATVVIAATLDAPAVGDELYIIDSSASGTAAHTVTLSGGVTWDGTNTVATLNAPGEALHVIAISATRWFILENIGSVALS